MENEKQENTIVFKNRELKIRDFKSKDGWCGEVVEIRGGVAFNEDFIAECKAKGVRKITDEVMQVNEDLTEEDNEVPSL